MNKLLSEILKIDTAITSQALAAIGTSPYYNMKKCRKALFVAEVGAMAAGVTSVLAAWEARDAAATGAQAIAAITATITANTKVAEATLTLLNVVVADIVVINGLTYTAAAVADIPNRVFDQSGTDTQDAASLVLCINHATGGVPGVTATNAAGVVTLLATEPGEMDITVTLPAATITVATVRAVGYLEIDANQMTKATALVAAYTHIAIAITPSVATQTGAVLIRDNARYTPTQYVGAQDYA